MPAKEVNQCRLKMQQNASGRAAHSHSHTSVRQTRRGKTQKWITRCLKNFETFEMNLWHRECSKKKNILKNCCVRTCIRIICLTCRPIEARQQLPDSDLPWFSQSLLSKVLYGATTASSLPGLLKASLKNINEKTPTKCAEKRKPDLFV
jgi:hypothetical protein